MDVLKSSGSTGKKIHEHVDVSTRCDKIIKPLHSDVLGCVIL